VKDDKALQKAEEAVEQALETPDTIQDVTNFKVVITKVNNMEVFG